MASEKNGSPSSRAIPACSSIMATSRTFLTRRLKSVNGKATCTMTVPYVSTITITPLDARMSERPGQGAK